MKTMSIETIFDQMLHDLFTTEQISSERYREEVARRAAEHVTKENTASRLDDIRHWRCFHCDEVFTTEDAARLHFGETECQSPACQIKAGAELSMLEALRRAEEEARKAVIAMHEEGTDGWTAFRRLECRTRQNAEAAESLGYERGLRDGREDAARFVEQRLHDYVSEHGSTDPETGTVEYPGDGEEYVYELEEIVEGIRALTSPTEASGVKP